MIPWFRLISSRPYMQLLLYIKCVCMERLSHLREALTWCQLLYNTTTVVHPVNKCVFSSFTFTLNISPFATVHNCFLLPLSVHWSFCLSFPSSSLDACLVVKDSSCAGIHLAGNSVLTSCLRAWRHRSWELKNQETAFILSVSCLLLPTPNSASEKRRRDRVKGGGDKSRTVCGNYITQREMKGRESETESQLSLRKRFFLPPSFLAPCFSGCFDVFRQTHSAPMVKQACRQNTTDEECQLVVRGSHMLLISLSFPSPTSLSVSLSTQSYSLHFLALSLSQLSCWAEHEISPLPKMWSPAGMYSKNCAPTPLGRSHSLLRSGCKKSPSQVIILNTWVII